MDNTDKMVAWFVCRVPGIVDDVALAMKNGADFPDSATIARKGRMRAARAFKARHNLHPCRKVDVEFQFVMPAHAYAATLADAEAVRQILDETGAA